MSAEASPHISPILLIVIPIDVVHLNNTLFVVMDHRRGSSTSTHMGGEAQLFILFEVFF